MLDRIALILILPRILSLEKAEFAPFSTVLIWDEGKVWNPDQTAQKVCSRRIKEFLAGYLIPLRFIKDIVGF